MEKNKIFQMNEIFISNQGEGRFVGLPCLFVRFAGCDKACIGCDTNKKTQIEANVKDVINNMIIPQTNKLHKKHVVITGGEPFLQEGYMVKIINDLICEYKDDVIIEIFTAYRMDNVKKLLEKYHDFDNLFITYDTKNRTNVCREIWNTFPPHLLKNIDFKFFANFPCRKTPSIQELKKMQRQGINISVGCWSIYELERQERFDLLLPYTGIFRLDIQVHSYTSIK